MLIFVYGTLKSTHSNHQILQNVILKKPDSYYEKFTPMQLEILQEFKNCVTKEKYPLYKEKGYGFEFPYLEYKSGNGLHIKGEMWEIEENKIKILDNYESNLFKKRKLIVILDNGEEKEVTAYFKNGNELRSYENVELLEEWN